MESETPPSSSFLDQLQNKLKKGALKPTTTKTTFPDGSVQYSSAQGSSEKVATEKSFGFVVDTKPDWTVGQVHPWLYISSQDPPTNAGILKEHGITHVVSLLPGFVLPPDTRDLIKDHLCLEVYDEVGFSLTSEEITSQAFPFIKQVKEDNGRVLVHCNAGLSRAPSVVIAYLMKVEGLSLEAAWETVKAARPGMCPNAGFVKQLQEMEIKSGNLN